MDESTATAILQAIKTLDERLETNKKDQRERDDKLFEQILSIKQNLVGRDMCQAHRTEIWAAIDKLKETCNSYENAKERLVDDTGLLRTELSVRCQVEEMIKPLIVDVNELRKQVAVATYFYDALKNNKSALIGAGSGLYLLMLVGIYGGRGIDVDRLGWQPVIIGFSGAIVGLTFLGAVIWAVWNRKQLYSWFGFS
jgi:hypothetical protein